MAISSDEALVLLAFSDQKDLSKEIGTFQKITENPLIKKRLLFLNIPKKKFLTIFQVNEKSLLCQ